MQYTLQDLLYLMSRLRDPQTGCPWDLEQDFKSITPSTIEEAYELVEAILDEDADQIKEELGDVLFQVVFYSQLASEKDWFGFDEIVHVLAAKLVRRHPHVFLDGELHRKFTGEVNTEEVNRQWELIKAEERKDKDKALVLDDIPLALPALSRAQKIQKRVSRVGFDWSSAVSAFEKIKEEIVELESAIESEQLTDIEEEFGDVLFSCVNVARHLGVDAESALAAGNRKFEQRFRQIEQALLEQGKTAEAASVEEMDVLWELVKSKK